MKKHVLLFAAAAVIATAWGEPAQAGETEERFKDIEADLEKLRKLKFNKKVPSADQSLADFRKFIEKDLEKEFPAKERKNMILGLRRLGLIKRDMDLGEELVSAILSQAAGYYDPAAGKFFIVFSELPDSYIKTIAAHEFVHALQDQHFNLDKLLKDATGKKGGTRNDDRVLALRYLVEGEATYVHTLWQMRRMIEAGMVDDRAIVRGLEQMASLSVEQVAQRNKAGIQAQQGEGMESLKKAAESMDKIPPYIMVPLMDAYLSGALYVARIKAKGGWKAVDKIYESIPVTVEQCLHPDRANDKPTPLPLPEFDVLAKAGWEKIDEAIHGERYMQLLLEMNGVDRKDTLKAAAGWDGDIYRAYRKGNAVLAVLLTTWDSEDDAKEFAAGYRKALKGKYPDLAEKDDASDDRAAYVCGETLGEGVFERRDREVFVVEGGGAQLNFNVLEALRGIKVVHDDPPAEAIDAKSTEPAFLP